MENFNQDHLSNLDLEIDRDVRLQLNDAAKLFPLLCLLPAV
jgi:hypothetical protein